MQYVDVQEDLLWTLVAVNCVNNINEKKTNVVQEGGGVWWCVDEVL